MDRGDLDDLKSQIQNLQFAQDWALDATGNWRNFREDDDGDATWDLNQQRTANKMNEISDIAESVGPSWATPVYNRVGNMTTIPKPADPTASFTAAYDAWNRLVKIEEGSDKVAEYEYDGAKRRSVKKTYESGQLDETRHLYYTEPSRWQVVEERLDSGTDAERQFVWGMRYVDDLLLRDRDTSDPKNGVLDERLYDLQDANWNVTAIASTDGIVQERYAYTAYGTPGLLTPTFTTRGSSSHDVQVLYAGYGYGQVCGLYFVRHRLYHPQLGCWLQRDPFQYADGTNLLGYVSSRPVVLTDAEGAIGWGPPGGPAQCTPAGVCRPYVPPPPIFPRPNRPNKKLPLGFPLCICPTKKKDRLKPILPPPTTLPVPPGGPPGGSSTHYPPGTAPIGAGGCGPCVAIVIKCPTGIAVYHFYTNDDPYNTLTSSTWPPGCQAIVCGGDDKRFSNCAADSVLKGAADAGISVVGVSGSSACGVAPGGGWYVGP